MTGWLDQVLLIRTAIRAAVSTVFGRFADRREAIAAANAIAPAPADAKLNYSAHQGEFWFDYLADTGDGWNPTYAMARLVSDDFVRVAGTDLPRGRLLVLSGGQVYPSASRAEYARRVRAPFEEAYRPNGTPRWKEDAEDARSRRQCRRSGGADRQRLDPQYVLLDPVLSGVFGVLG